MTQNPLICCTVPKYGFNNDARGNRAPIFANRLWYEHVTKNISLLLYGLSFFRHMCHKALFPHMSILRARIIIYTTHSIGGARAHRIWCCVRGKRDRNQNVRDYFIKARGICTI